jgi:hypothetical protein
MWNVSRCWHGRQIRGWPGEWQGSSGSRSGLRRRLAESGERGAITAAEVRQSALGFDEVALGAAWQWSFRPARIDGRIGPTFACDHCTPGVTCPVDVVPLLIERIERDESIRVRRMATIMLAADFRDARAAPVF